MTVHQFNSIEEFYAFVEQATADDVRPMIRHGWQIEVPDWYKPSEKVEGGDTVDSAFDTEEEVEETRAEEAAEAVEAYERNLAEGAQDQVNPPAAPARNASRDQWVDYANALGLDPGDKSRDDIIKMTEGR